MTIDLIPVVVERGLPAALDAIDLQLTADSDEVVLPRDAAELVACALHDLLGVPREGGHR